MFDKVKRITYKNCLSEQDILLNYSMRNHAKSKLNHSQFKLPLTQQII